MAANKDEKRKSNRVGFATDIQILFDSDGNQVCLEGNSKDLSLKGIFVQTETIFPARTPCTVKIYLTGGIDKIELSINAVVVRQTDSGMGIEYESMDVDSYAHLKNIVYYNSADDADEMT